MNHRVASERAHCTPIEYELIRILQLHNQATFYRLVSCAEYVSKASRGKGRSITLDGKTAVYKGSLCRVGNNGGPVQGGKSLETLSKEKRQFIIVYCTATTPPTNISLKKKLVGNWSLEKLNSRALGGDVLNEFGTFWLAYKEGSILSGRTTKDNSDLAAWLRGKYPELRQKLLEPLYDEILKEEERKKWWRMVGDEAGHEGELCYIWVVVPPTSNLKSCPFGFHAKEDLDDETKQPITRLLEELIKKAKTSVPEEKRVQIHVFHGGRLNKKKGEFAYTLAKLPHTIPLMMEAIRYYAGTDSEEELNLQILPENFGGGISSTAKHHFDALKSKYSDMKVVGSKPEYSGKNVGNQTYLEKNEHPYMAYPDAVGFVLNPKQTGANLRSNLEDIVIKWDFDQAASLSNELLNPKNLANAKKFYDALRTMDESWIRNQTIMDSIIKKYSKELINNLSIKQFISYEKDADSREVPNYQYASNRMIEDKGGIRSWINEIDKRAYRKLFNLNMSGLSYSNRRNDGENILAHIVELRRILELKESDIQLDRKNKFRDLAESSSHRLFAFDIIPQSDSLDEVADRAFGHNTNQDIRHHLTLRLLKEAYRDGPEVRPKIREYQKRLLDRKDGNRDSNYYLEMLVDLSRGTEDPEILDEALEIYEDYHKQNPNPWTLATRMKLGVELSNKNREIPEGIIELINDISDEVDVKDELQNNPILRCWSWGARLCDICGKTAKRDDFFDALYSRAEGALEGKIQPFKDALGLTHACHLIDLEDRGWGSVNTGKKIGNEYLDLVLKNSLRYARDWYEENKHKDDPLKPLNLMHR